MSVFLPGIKDTLPPENRYIHPKLSRMDLSCVFEAVGSKIKLNLVKL